MRAMDSSPFKFILIFKNVFLFFMYVGVWLVCLYVCAPHAYLGLGRQDEVLFIISSEVQPVIQAGFSGFVICFVLNVLGRWMFCLYVCLYTHARLMLSEA